MTSAASTVVDVCQDKYIKSKKTDNYKKKKKKLNLFKSGLQWKLAESYTSSCWNHLPMIRQEQKQLVNKKKQNKTNKQSRIYQKTEKSSFKIKTV